MRTSLTLFASAMLATAPFVLAGEGEWITEVLSVTTNWAPDKHPHNSTCTEHGSYSKHTPPASYPSNTPSAPYYPAGTGSYYPWYPATTVTVFITVYPESCAATPSSTPASPSTTAVVPPPVNSTGSSTTPSYAPSANGTTNGTTGSNATNGTMGQTSEGAAPMGISFTAGIVGALGVLFALL